MSRPVISVIGGGPAGLMVAERLSRSASVTVHERMPTVGRKFLMAGRGGLNLTHGEPVAQFVRRYRGAMPWLAPTIEAFCPSDLVAWAEALGQATFIGSSGRVFPTAMKASPLLRAWVQRLRGLGVDVTVGSNWTGFDPATGHPTFTDTAGRTRIEAADAVVLALGGASWPRLGSNGAWVPVLRDAAVEIADLRPANMGCTVAWSPHMARHFGQPLKRIALTVVDADQELDTHLGEAVITATGFEGGAIYAASSFMRDALAAGRDVRLRIDLRPDLTIEALAARLAAAPPKRSLATRLLREAGLSPAAAAVLREASPDARPPAAATELALAIKSVTVPITGVAGIDRAISSAGGVRRSAVDANLMLTALPGVFVAGEMLDWEAPTGGYLLQATFSTAVAAAEGTRAWLASGHRLGQSRADRVRTV